MKKTIALVLALMLALCLAACGAGAEKTAEGPHHHGPGAADACGRNCQ